MLSLYVNGERVQIEANSISYHYDLNSDIPSSFTTQYTTTVEIPLSGANNKIFNYPHLPNQDETIKILRKSYPYTLYNDSILIDSGVLVPSSITPLSLSCNLFSYMVDINSQLSELSTFSDCWSTIPYIEGEERYVPDTGWNLSVYRAPNSGNLILQDYNNLYLSNANSTYNSSGFLKFGMSNIGIPNDNVTKFDATKLYSYSGDSETIPESEVWQSSHGSHTFAFNCPQFRVWQLTPVMPLRTLFENVLHKSDKFEALSSGAIEKLSFTYVTLPSFTSLRSEDSLSPSRGSAGVSTFSFTSPYSGAAIYYPNIKKSDGSSYPNNWVKEGTSVVSMFFEYAITDDQGYSKNVVIGPKDKYTLYNAYANKRFPSGTYTYQEYSDDNKIVLDNLVSSSTVTVSLRSLSRYISGFTTINWIFAMGYYDTKNLSGASHFCNDTLSMEFNYGATSFSLSRYFTLIESPYSLVLDIMKKLGLRFSLNNEGFFSVVTNAEFVGSSVYDITKFASSYNYDPSYWKYQYLIFNDSFIDNLNYPTYYRDKYNKEYGEYKYYTGYPNDSKDWFEFNKLKSTCTSTWIYNNNPVSSSVQYTVKYIAQALDNNRKQVDISYCLVRLYRYTNANGACIVDDVPDTDGNIQYGYFDESYESHISNRSILLLNYIEISTIWTDFTESFLTGNSLEYPYGIYPKSVITTPMLVNGDAFTVTVDMDLYRFLSVNRLTFNTFLHSMIWYDNKKWIVANVDSYVPDSNNLTTVTLVQYDK